MDYEHEQAVEISRRTPTTLTALLRGLPEAVGPWRAYLAILTRPILTE